MESSRPPKLGPGARVRVIAPARSMSIIAAHVRQTALDTLARLGLEVSFGGHVAGSDDFASTSVDARVEDLHAAFADPDVHAVLSVIGGFNSNQLLRRIDWDVLAQRPKVLCGFSDITALSMATHAMTGLVTYSGPHFSTFGMRDHNQQTVAWFRSCVFTDEPIDVRPAAEWTDDQWFFDQNDRKLQPNEGWWEIAEGEAEGAALGGNLSTVVLLHGTEYLPSLDGSVLFLEDDEESRPHHFDRNLVSVMQQPGFAGVRGLVIGRFQRASGMTRQLLTDIVTSKRELRNLPVLANVDFGHTSPMLTIPIGGHVRVHVITGRSELVIDRH